MSTAAEIAAILGGKPNGSGLIAHCPCHSDGKASLSISEGADGRVLLHCHAGCSQTALVDWARANGYELSGRRSNGNGHAGGRFAAEYDYRDRDGNVRYQVVRRWPKAFQQRQPDGNGGWIWNMNGVEPLPYRLPEMLAAPDKPIFIVEGEKDADQLAKEGLLATTNHGGAGKWRTELCRWFKDRSVVIVPDNDKAGHDHGQDVARKLHGIAKRICIVELPDLPEKGDASDWLDAGHTVRDLRRLAHKAPAWEPGKAEAAEPPPNETEPSAGSDTDWRTNLIVDKHGKSLALESNAMLMMREHEDVAGLFGLDEFSQSARLMRRPPWANRSDQKFPRPVRDADLSDLLAWLQRQGIHLHGRSPVRTALASVVRDHAFHPVRDYLDGLVWDKKPRLDSWLTDYLGVVPIENYTAPVSCCWMISAVARIYQPGCIAKYVLVIEGKQDLGKSTALRILGDPWFTDDIATLGSKDSQMQVGNAWIIELAELDSTRRADINSIKAFISRPIDRFRPPYGEHLIDQQRQCVLAATVNPAGAYLHDETGAVRFWPVAAIKIDFDALRKDRDQLWAEAVARYKAGEKWWPDDTFQPAEEQEARSETAESDPWFDLVKEWLDPSDDKLTASRILSRALDIPKERMDRKAELRLGKILRKLGYESKTVRTQDEDKPVKRWCCKQP